MPSKKKQGASPRTPFKHALLNDMTGRMAAIVVRNSEPWLYPNLRFIDLCAGNGVDGEHGVCSPGIFCRHAEYAYSNGLAEVRVDLVERDLYQFDSLSKRFGGNPLITAHHMDASDFFTSFDPTENRILHIDPNAASEIPNPTTWGNLLNDRSFLLMTLGCNTAGLKRLPLSAREPWFEYVATVERWLPFRFDMLFIALRNDSHQWAYLYVTPNKWVLRDRSRFEKSAKKVLPIGLQELDVFSYRLEPGAFRESVRRHFLTKAELGDAA